MNKLNFVLGTAGLVLSALVILAIACGPHVGQSFALLAASVSVLACGKLAVDQL